VILKWGATFARTFNIQVSADAAKWTDVFSTTDGACYSVTDEIFKTTSARYVRMYATERGSPPAVPPSGRRGSAQPAAQPATQTSPQGGYSLFDFEVLKD
jgi:hypothetical protein